MAMGYAQRRELLKKRYGTGSAGLDPVRVLSAVAAAANGHFTLPEQARPIVPTEDLLAALSQVPEARSRLDQVELDLIRAARSGTVSWQSIADALGLKSRQSAEAKALRLERATAPTGGDRDVAAQRAHRARQRATTAWCRKHEERIRGIAEHLVSTAGAWPQLTDDTLAALSVQSLTAALEAGGDGAQLVGYMAPLEWRLSYEASTPAAQGGWPPRPSRPARTCSSSWPISAASPTTPLLATCDQHAPPPAVRATSAT